MKSKKNVWLTALICTLIYADAFTICYIDEGKSLLYSLLVPLMPFGVVAVALVVAWMIADAVMGEK